MSPCPRRPAAGAPSPLRWRTASMSTRPRRPSTTPRPPPPRQSISASRRPAHLRLPPGCRRLAHAVLAPIGIGLPAVICRRSPYMASLPPLQRWRRTRDTSFNIKLDYADNLEVRPLFKEIKTHGFESAKDVNENSPSPPSPSIQTDLGIVMDSNVQYSEEENCSADEHMIDNKHPGEIEQKYKNDQTQNTGSKMYYREMLVLI